MRRDQLSVIVQLYLTLGGGSSMSDEVWVTGETDTGGTGATVIPVDTGASNEAFVTPTTQRGRKALATPVPSP